jgi:putative inorganic carbon (HCO3(-)) transporter
MITFRPAWHDLAILYLLAPVAFWVYLLPDRSMIPAAWLLICLALFYGVKTVASRPGWSRRLAKGLLLAGLALAISSPLTVNTWNGSLLPDSIRSGYRSAVFNATGFSTEFLFHPNDLSGALLLVLPLALGLVLFGSRQSGRGERLLGWVSVVILGGVLVALRSQGALAGSLAAVSLLAILRWRGWGAAAVLVGTAILAAVFTFDWLPMLEALTLQEFWQDVNERKELWQRGIFIIQDFPLSGIGLGNYPEVVQLMYPLFEHSGGNHAHNLFLQVAVDLGLPGLMAWLAVFGSVILSAWRMHRKGWSLVDDRLVGLGAGLLAAQLALAVHGFVDAAQWGIFLGAPIIWFLWGLALGTGLNQKSIDKEGPQPASREST